MKIVAFDKDGAPGVGVLSEDETTVELAVIIGKGGRGITKENARGNRSRLMEAT